MLRHPYYLDSKRYNICMGREEAYLYKDLDFLNDEAQGPLSRIAQTDPTRPVRTSVVRSEGEDVSGGSSTSSTIPTSSSSLSATSRSIDLGTDSITIIIKDCKILGYEENPFGSRKRKNSQDLVQFVYDISKLLSLARPS